MEKDITYRKKNVGQVFTPQPLVKLILDFVGYNGSGILRKHIIDNSCGEGAFLMEAVGRYCSEFLAVSNDKAQLRRELGTYIHGIEIEESTYQVCLEQLDRVVRSYGLTDVHWDVIRANALHVDAFNGQMDFVVGNPPYVRVHNLQDSYRDVKKYAFSDKGMTDLFIVFFEIGFRMMRADGRMAYITPSSWLTSKAGGTLREYLIRSKKLKKVIDLGHRQAFEKVTTYTLVSYFENDAKYAGMSYYRYDETDEHPTFICQLTPEEYFIQGHFYLGTADQLHYLRNILQGSYPQRVKVKNGFATLADSIFIGNVPDSPLTIPILKASTGKWTKGLFPYSPEGTPLTWDDILSVRIVAEYFKLHREELQKNNTENNGWYLYGRTQALRDVRCPKVAISTLVRDVANMKINYVAPGCGLYSGLYILGTEEARVREWVETDAFLNYIALLRNYKSGGYYTFSSKSLEQYLNYQINQQYGKCGQSNVSTFCGAFF